MKRLKMLEKAAVTAMVGADVPNGRVKQYGCDVI